MMVALLFLLAFLIVSLLKRLVAAKFTFVQYSRIDLSAYILEQASRCLSLM